MPHPRRGGGELFKAVRKHLDARSEIGDADDELADLLVYLCAIANRLDVDLERAFRDKEARNHRRRWR